jgi:hypothetical protein
VGISFQKAAKPSLIPWNGSVALKFFTAQPAGGGQAPEESLRYNDGPRCLHRAPYHSHGGVRHALKNLCCGLLKRDPRGPFGLIFKALNCYDVFSCRSNKSARFFTRLGFNNNDFIRFIILYETRTFPVKTILSQY